MRGDGIWRSSLNSRANLEWIETASLAELMAVASGRRDRQFGRFVSYSRKVFVH